MRDLQRNARRAKAAARFRAAAEKAGVVLPEGTSLAVIMLLCTLRRGPMLGAVSRAKRGGKADAMLPHPSLGAAIKAGLARFEFPEKWYVITDAGAALWQRLEDKGLLTMAASLAAWVEGGGVLSAVCSVRSKNCCTIYGLAASAGATINAGQLIYLDDTDLDSKGRPKAQAATPGGADV